MSKVLFLNDPCLFVSFVVFETSLSEMFQLFTAVLCFVRVKK